MLGYVFELKIWYLSGFTWYADGTSHDA